LANCEAETGEL